MQKENPFKKRDLKIVNRFNNGVANPKKDKWAKRKYKGKWMDGVFHSPEEIYEIIKTKIANKKKEEDKVKEKKDETKD